MTILPVLIVCSSDSAINSGIYLRQVVQSYMVQESVYNTNAEKANLP